MDTLTNWLQSFELETYSSALEDNGWNEMTLLHDLTEDDINTCIPKGGNAIRLIKARESLRSLSDEPGSQSTFYKREMEKVFTWLKINNLGLYSPKFNEQAWDNLSLLEFMTNLDLETCITKRGDIARFKRCLSESLITEHHTGDGSQLLSTATINVPSRGQSSAEITHHRISDVTTSDVSVKEYLSDKEECSDKEYDSGARNKYRDVACNSTCITGLSSAQVDERKGPSYTDCRIGFSAHTTVYKYKVSPTYIIQDPSSNSTTTSFSSFETTGRIFAKRYDSKKHLFVKTRAFEEMNNILEKTEGDRIYWATLLGRPGDGKSTLIAHLMLSFMRDGYQPIILSSPNDWRDFIAKHDMEDETSKHFVIIDDMFGQSFLNIPLFHGWLAQIQTMQPIAEERTDKMIIVCASRRYIYADVEPALASYSAFKKYMIVNMTEEEFRLTSKDKVAMFNKYADKYNFPRNEEDIAKEDPPHGFPHCVQLYSTNVFYRRLGIKSFFSNPSECVRKEIRNFRFNDPFKFLVLLLLLLSNNRLDVKDIESMIDNPSDAQLRILKFIGVSSRTATSKIYKAINALKNTYLIQASDGSYCFTHESLKENVASEFINQHPSLAIEIIDVKYIDEYINVRDTKTDLESGNTPHFRIDIECIKPIATRITEEILKGKTSDVSACNAWSATLFLQAWKTYITDIDEQKLSDILTSSKGHYPNCPIGRTADELRSPSYCCDVDDTLLEFLSKSRKYDAILSMLENEAVKTFIKQHLDIWKKIAEHILDHLECTSNGYISVAKSVLNILHETRLSVDGTIALKNALMVSDTEYANILIHDAHIRLSPNFIGESSGCLFHYLVQSDLTFDDFDKLSKLLVRLGADINLCNTTGDTPLLLCMNNVVNGRQLIQKFECLVSLYERNSYTILECLQNAVLHISTAKVFQTVVSSLLKYGNDINMKDKTGRSALYMFVQNELMSHGEHEGFEMKLRYLVSLGADANTRLNDNDIGILHMLANSDVSFDKFKYIHECMLQCGADPDIKDALGNTPLNYCIRKHTETSMDRCAYLIRNGTKLQQQDYESDNFLLTALEVCTNTTVMEILPQISDCTDDYTVVDGLGQNAMHYVFKSKQQTSCEKLFNYLTAAGVTFNRTDNVGRLPVMLALENGFELSLLRRLIQECPTNVRDNLGRGVFHYLCRSKSGFDHFRKCCKLLMENGEDIDMQDCDKMSPILIAIANSHLTWKYIEFLHRCGANLWTRDALGRNAIVFALLQKREEIDMCLLLRYLLTVGKCLTWK